MYIILSFAYFDVKFEFFIFALKTLSTFVWAHAMQRRYRYYFK